MVLKESPTVRKQQEGNAWTTSSHYATPVRRNQASSNPTTMPAHSSRGRRKKNSEAMAYSLAKSMVKTVDRVADYVGTALFEDYHYEESVLTYQDDQQSELSGVFHPFRCGGSTGQKEHSFADALNCSSPCEEYNDDEEWQEPDARQATSLVRNRSPKKRNSPPASPSSIAHSRREVQPLEAAQEEEEDVQEILLELAQAQTAIKDQRVACSKSESLLQEDNEEEEPLSDAIKGERLASKDQDPGNIVQEEVEEEEEEEEAVDFYVSSPMAGTVLTKDLETEETSSNSIARDASSTIVQAEPSTHFEDGMAGKGVSSPTDLKEEDSMAESRASEDAPDAVSIDGSTNSKSTLEDEEHEKKSDHVESRYLATTESLGLTTEKKDETSTTTAEHAVLLVEDYGHEETSIQESLPKGSTSKQSSSNNTVFCTSDLIQASHEFMQDVQEPCLAVMDSLQLLLEEQEASKTKATELDQGMTTDDGGLQVAVEVSMRPSSLDKTNVSKKEETAVQEGNKEKAGRPNGKIFSSSPEKKKKTRKDKKGRGGKFFKIFLKQGRLGKLSQESGSKALTRELWTPGILASSNGVEADAAEQAALATQDALAYLEDVDLGLETTEHVPASEEDENSIWLKEYHDWDSMAIEWWKTDRISSIGSNDSPVHVLEFPAP